MERRIAAENVEDYLSQVKREFRPALDHLRAVIRDMAPDAEEVVSYGIPCYKLDGPLVSFGAASKHCAFYGMSPNVLERFAGDLKSFSTSPGTVRFTPEHPIPDALVRAILTARIAENSAIVAAREAKKTQKTSKSKA